MPPGLAGPGDVRYSRAAPPHVLRATPATCSPNLTRPHCAPPGTASLRPQRLADSPALSPQSLTPSGAHALPLPCLPLTALHALPHTRFLETRPPLPAPLEWPLRPRQPQPSAASAPASLPPAAQQALPSPRPGPAWTPHQDSTWPICPAGHLSHSPAHTGCVGHLFAVPSLCLQGRQLPVFLTASLGPRLRGAGGSHSAGG